jgi:hypothetical protein
MTNDRATVHGGICLPSNISRASMHSTKGDKSDQIVPDDLSMAGRKTAKRIPLIAFRN